MKEGVETLGMEILLVSMGGMLAHAATLRCRGLGGRKVGRSLVSGTSVRRKHYWGGKANWVGGVTRNVLG